MTKHGHAKRAVIEIDRSPTTVELTIRDDGNGFDPSAATSGVGLLGMRERAQLLDGTVRIQSSVGAGTEVKVSFPTQRRFRRDAAATHHAILATLAS